MNNPTVIHQEFWTISQNKESSNTWSNIVNVDLNVGLVNNSEMRSETKKIYLKCGHEGFRLDDVWLPNLDKYPVIRIPSFYHPDYFYNNGLRFVSPKLFELLDQPRGTLQGLKTDTNWFGADKPDFSYLWLSFIPHFPAIDLDRCHPHDVHEETDRTGGNPIPQIRWRNYMPLRQNITCPFGVFRATESTATLLATDAVALSVLQAGCTGIAFNEVETNFIRHGPLHRRGLRGVELSPSALEAGPDPAAAFREVREEAERACLAAAAVTPEEKARKRAIRTALNEAALRAGIWHVSGLELADQSGVTMDEAGVVHGIDALLANLRQTRGYMFLPDTSDNSHGVLPGV